MQRLSNAEEEQAITLIFQLVKNSKQNMLLKNPGVHTTGIREIFLV